MSTELGWRWEALQVIKQMETCRVYNNIAWMNVLRLAVSHAPQAEVKQLFETISRLDEEINKLWRTLRSKIPD